MTPRPAGITEADLTRWRELMQEAPPDIPGPLLRERGGEERCFAGCWLDEELERRGAAEKERLDLCFAAGQRMSQFGDPWGSVLHVLGRWERGEPPVPGNAYGMELIQEAGLWDDPVGLLRTFVARGISPEDLESLIRRRGPAPSGPYAGLFEDLARTPPPEAGILRLLALYRRLWEKRGKEGGS